MRFLSVSILCLCSLILDCNSGKAQWIQTNGPYGGPIYTLVASGENLYATSTHPFLSTDKGSHWSRFIAPGSGPFVHDKDLFFFNWNSNRSTIYHTSDYGASWDTATDSISAPYSFGSFMVGNGSTLLIGDDDWTINNQIGLYRSVDNGRTWELSGSEIRGSLMTLAAHGDFFYAGTSAGVYCSRDLGKTWTLSDSSSSRIAVGSMGIIGSDLIAITAKGLARSTDSGKTWSPSSNGIDDTILFSITAIDTYAFVSTYSGLYRSSDHGLTWTPANSGIAKTATPAVLTKIDQDIFAGTGAGVYTSTNMGMSWSNVSSDLLDITASVAANPDGSRLHAYGENLLQYLSTDDGRNWLLEDSDPYVFSIVEAPGQLLGASGGLYRSTDDGWHWIEIPYHKAKVMSGPNFALIDSTLVVSELNVGVFRSTDLGKNWTPATNGLVRSNGAEDSTNIIALASDSTNFYAGTYFAIYRSSDAGAHWTWSSTGFGGYPSAIEANEENVFAIKYRPDSNINPLFRSSDHGLTWLPVSGFPGPRSPLHLMVRGKNIFVDVGDDVMISKDNGVHWFSIDKAGLPGSPLHFALTNAEAYVAVDNTGIWRRPLSELIGQSAVHEMPRSTSAFHIYPNPTAQSTTITFTSESPGLSEISVINALGVEIARLFSGELDASEHSFTWDAARVGAPLGVYECIVRMSGRVQAMPIIVE